LRVIAKDLSDYISILTPLPACQRISQPHSDMAFDKPNQVIDAKFVHKPSICNGVQQAKVIAPNAHIIPGLNAACSNIWGRFGMPYIIDFQ